MSNLRKELIRLGSNNPGLRKDIRPILARITGKRHSSIDPEGLGIFLDEIKYHVEKLFSAVQGMKSRDGLYHRDSFERDILDNSEELIHILEELKAVF